jgi:hypothetical protein
MTEEWRDAQVYRNGKLIKFDDYQVERYSQQVKSFKRDKINGRILKTRLDKDGYPTLHLRYNQKIVNFHLHKVMADTFIPNPLNLPQINHKNIDNLDGRLNKLDNRLENLEHCTASHNNKHAFAVLGKKPTWGEINGQAKLTEANVKDILKLLDKGKLSHRQIGDMFGVTHSMISFIHNGKYWSHLTDIVYTKKLHGCSNLTEEQAIGIYNDSWFSGLSSKAIASKHNVTVSIVKHIKYGTSWSTITHHFKGTKLSLINKQITEDITKDTTNLDYWL